MNNWIDWAEKLYHVACLAQEDGLPDHVCFFCRQGALGYVRAAMLAAGVRGKRRDHSLATAHRMLIEADTRYELLREHVTILNPYTMSITYPGRTASTQEAERALRTAREVRSLVRQLMALDVDQWKDNET